MKNESKYMVWDETYQRFIGNVYNGSSGASRSHTKDEALQTASGRTESDIFILESIPIEKYKTVRKVEVDTVRFKRKGK